MADVLEKNKWVKQLPTTQCFLTATSKLASVLDLPTSAFQTHWQKGK